MQKQKEDSTCATVADLISNQKMLGRSWDIGIVSSMRVKSVYA